MTILSPKSVNNYLKSSDKDLEFILKKAIQLEKINQKVHALLDKNIAHLCRVANIKENQLIMIAANGGIATTLRYQSIELIKKFKQYDDLKHIKTILCKVSPTFNLSEREPPANIKMAPLSKETSNLIKNIADSIADLRLKEVMERIAKHTNTEER